MIYKSLANSAKEKYDFVLTEDMYLAHKRGANTFGHKIMDNFIHIQKPPRTDTNIDTSSLCSVFYKCIDCNIHLHFFQKMFLTVGTIEAYIHPLMAGTSPMSPKKNLLAYCERLRILI